MEEKKSIKISLSTFFLILAIIVIFIMAYAIYRVSIDKVKEQEKVANLTKEVSRLENVTNTSQGKMDSLFNPMNASNTSTNTINDKSANNNSNSINGLDKKYENSTYGIIFSYPSSFSNHENSLTNDMVESFRANKGNEIVITRNSGETIESQVNFVKNMILPDGSKYELEIKKEGYVTLNSGTKGYRMDTLETNDNRIRFVTEKDNIVFAITLKYTADNEQLANSILNSVSM